MVSANNTRQRLERFAAHRDAWEAELNGMAHVHEYAADAEAGRMVPRQVSALAIGAARDSLEFDSHFEIQMAIK